MRRRLVGDGGFCAVGARYRQSGEAGRVPDHGHADDGADPAERGQHRRAQGHRRPDKGSGRLQGQPLCGGARCPPHGGGTARCRHLRRDPQGTGLFDDRPQQGPRRRRREGLCAVDQDGGAERGLLLEGWPPLSRRAEPRAVVPGGRVLLRRTGCGGLRHRQAGRAHSGFQRELQPYRAHLPGRARRPHLHHDRPALQRAGAGDAAGVRAPRASAASSA